MKKIITLTLFLFFFLSVRPVLAAPLTLSDFWQGKATWKSVFTLPEDGTTTGPWRAGFGAAAQVVVVGNNWYLFDRHVDWGPFGDCPQTRMTLEVRESTDSGHTWSNPVDILTHTPTYQECNITDGGVYYQQSTNTWHILYQCLGVGTGWKGCHATRVASDPLGPFTPDPGNPVIQPGSIWSKICDSPQDKCVKESLGRLAGKPVDEGTFDIITFDGQYYWISFHGYDGTYGFRGIAKTADFHTFIAGDPAQGVPSDSVLNPSDLLIWNVSWNGPPIGVGASRTIKDGNYYYQFIEGYDGNLGGGSSVGHGGWGMYRSSSLSSLSWEQPTAFQNPIIINNPILQAVDSAAGPSYGGIFKDSSGKIYLEIIQGGYISEYSGIFFFSLFNPADIDQNEKVDIFDYNQMVSDFGKSGSHSNLTLVPFVPSDINNDGKVDIFDYNQLVANFGE